MGRFLAGGTGLELSSVVPPWCRGNVPAGTVGRSRGAGRAEEGPRRLPTAGLFLALEVFGPRHWVSLPGWFVLKSLPLLIWQKAGQAGQVVTHPLSLGDKCWVKYLKRGAPKPG